MPSIDPSPLTAAQVRVHVIPGRKGVWSVRAADDGSAASVHTSATEAERAAHRYAQARGATHVVVHDRYARVHTSPVRLARAGMERWSFLNSTERES